ncbi:MAG: arylsulfatase [Pirellulaceae bacterium]
MRHLIFALGILGGCWATLQIESSAVAADRPNVLVFLADDLGFSDLGCYGGEIETPNFDALAANGLRYTQFYNTARCWPTRAAILSGYYPQQIGRDALPGVAGGTRGGRPPWAQLLPRMLKPLGYRSYLSGKWHIDGTPIRSGFDRSLTMDDHNRFFYPQKMTKDDKKLPPIEKGTDYYATTGIADHAIEVLKEHQAEHSDQPFFHYVAFISPHFPLHAPAEDIAKYRGRFDRGWDVSRQERWQRLTEKGIVKGPLAELEPEIGPPYRKWSDPAKEELGEKEVVLELPWDSLSETQKAFQAAKMEIHAAMIDRMDQEAGRIIDQVKAMGQFEDTLILFLSDNGASAEIMIRGDGHNPDAPLGSGESYLCLGPGWSSAANTPFRRHKTWVHEGGASTPLIAHWPNGISEKDALRERIGHVVDIPPTIVELAGGTWPTEANGVAVPPPPGASFVDSFSKDQQDPERTIWWLHEENRALRKGDYKLVAGRGESWQLYNMIQDRAESNDLRLKMPAKARELQNEWESLTEQFIDLAEENAKFREKKNARQKSK